MRNSRTDGSRGKQMMRTGQVALDVRQWIGIGRTGNRAAGQVVDGVDTGQHLIECRCIMEIADVIGNPAPVHVGPRRISIQHDHLIPT